MARLARWMLLVLALIPVASAHAGTYSVDFSTGPLEGVPINDDYVGTAFVEWFKDDPGYRPARRQIGSSGNFAGDIGPDRCLSEGGQGADCEFLTGGTNIQLVKTATDVSLDAGAFSAVGPDIHVQLKAYTAGGSAAGTSPLVTVHQGTTSFADHVTVHGSGIQRVDVVFTGNDAQNAEVGIDNLSVTYPENESPDVGLSATNQTVVIPQGGSVDVPVSIVRVNGSAGNLSGSFGGLPAGVTASFVPDPVTGNTAAVRFTSTTGAAIFFDPQTVTATLTPASVAVAPGPRSVPLSVTVRSAFDLSRSGTGAVPVPLCAPADVGFTVAREFGFSSNKTVTLALSGVPAGIGAQLLPSSTVPPGGGLNQDMTLRITRPVDGLTFNRTLTITASSPGYPSRTLSIQLTDAAPTAALDSTSLRGVVPQRLQPGTRIRMTSNGFCPGTKVQVGNANAIADTEPDPGAPDTALYFRIPRLATTGTARPFSTANRAYDVTNSLTVDSPRNSSGFPFHNPGWGNLSFDEITNLVGVDEMFLKVNLCWPLDCSVPTPIPDPFAYAEWQIIEQMAQASGGHCYGISRFVQLVGAGKLKPSQFASGAGKVFDLPHNGAVGSKLDELHAGQFTGEFIGVWLHRDKSVATQLDRARAELAAGRLPAIVIKNGLTEGHVVIGTDIEDMPDGTTVIHLYDNNVQYQPTIEEKGDGADHKNAEVASEIVINAAKTQWHDNDLGWQGGGGSIYTTKVTDIPDDPSLPEVHALADAVLFGSANGAATSGTDVPDGAELLPALDSNAIPGAAGTLATLGKGPLTHEMIGQKAGSYDQLFTGDGFIGGVHAPTAKGVKDTLTGDGNTVAFAGSTARPIDLKVGTEGDGSSKVATISGKTDGATASLSGGQVGFVNQGAPTTVTMKLESVTKGKGTSTFMSGPMHVGHGKALKVRADWTRLRAVRVNGHRVRNRARRLPVRVRMARASRKQLTLRFVKVPAQASAGVIVRVGGKKQVFTVKKLRAGKRSFKLAGRRGRLRVDVFVAALGSRSGSRHTVFRKRV